jgi:hypothetical protein
MTQFWKLLSFFTWLFLVSCSTEPRNAGGAVGETTNGLELTLLSQDSTDIEDGELVVFPVNLWQYASPELFIDSLTLTDKTLLLENLEPGVFWVIAKQHDLSARKLLSFSDSFQKDTLTLGPTFAFQGRVENVSGNSTGEIAFQKVFLEGFPGAATLNAQGTFTFDSLPKGSYTLLAQQHDRLLQAGEFSLFQDVQSEAFTVDTTGILIDNFNDGDVFPTLSSLTHWGSSWLFWSLSDSTAELPENAVYEPAELLLQDNSGDNPSFFLGLTVPEELEPSALEFVSFGVGFARRGKGFPINTIGSIKFRARGSGDWHLRLTIDSLGTDSTYTGFSMANHLDASLEFQLSESEWQNITLPIDSLNTYVDEDWHENAVVHQIYFQATSGWLHVDDLYFTGTDISTLQ